MIDIQNSFVILSAILLVYSGLWAALWFRLGYLRGKLDGMTEMLEDVKRAYKSVLVK